MLHDVQVAEGDPFVGQPHLGRGGGAMGGGGRPMERGFWTCDWLKDPTNCGFPFAQRVQVASEEALNDPFLPPKSHPHEVPRETCVSWFKEKPKRTSHHFGEVP